MSVPRLDLQELAARLKSALTPKMPGGIQISGHYDPRADVDAMVAECERLRAWQDGVAAESVRAANAADAAEARVASLEAELRDTRTMFAAVVLSNGGELIVTPHALTVVGANTVVEREDDPITHAVKFRALPVPGASEGGVAGDTDG